MQEIKLLNIEKSFGDKKVLSGVRLSLSPRARIALMGASGIGKTTLLRILLGLEKADGGSISGVSARVSVVFQEDRLCPWLSVRENLRLAAPHASDEAIRKTLAALGLAGEEDTKAAALSGGMGRRVAIARACLFDGDLFVLDEPFRGLDEESRARTAAYVSACTEGKTLLLVTHDMREAELLGATVVDDLFA